MSAEILTIIFPALVTGLLISAIHVPLGMEVFRRGIIFIDLAIAQIAALGVIVAGFMMHDASPYTKQALALSFAFIAAFYFKRIEGSSQKEQEAIIGSCFIVASSLAILLVANNPYGHEEIEVMLTGQILWVSWQQILVAAVIYTALLTLWFKRRGRGLFYYIFAIAVTSSVQLVGVYLVFASLILPALATQYCKHNRLIKAYLLSAISLIIGLIVSSLMDYPTGPVLVCILAVNSLIMCRLSAFS